MTINSLHSIRNYLKSKGSATRYEIERDLKVNYRTSTEALDYLQHVEKTIERKTENDKTRYYWN